MTHKAWPRLNHVTWPLCEECGLVMNEYCDSATAEIQNCAHKVAKPFCFRWMFDVKMVKLLGLNIIVKYNMYSEIYSKPTVTNLLTLQGNSKAHASETTTLCPEHLHTEIPLPGIAQGTRQALAKSFSVGFPGTGFSENRAQGRKARSKVGLEATFGRPTDPNCACTIFAGSLRTRSTHMATDSSLDRNTPMQRTGPDTHNIWSDAYQRIP